MLKERPRLHSYGYTFIELFFNLVLHGPTSLRGASGALAQFLPYLDGNRKHRPPCPNTGVNWLLRVGLYELVRPLEVAEDWVWIVDHTVQLGSVRCLVIVGCRLSEFQQLQRPLTHQDLSLIALEPSTSSDSRTVEAELRKAALRTGVPRAILSDGARNLKRAIRDFQATHPHTEELSDVKHKLALLLQQELNKDTSWTEFVGKSATARHQLIYDPLAYLAPPTPKHKARYMNLGELVAWATKIRRFLDSPFSPDGKEFNIGKLNLTLGWLRHYDSSIADWACLMQVIEASLKYLRLRGYHQSAPDELAGHLANLVNRPAARRLVDRLVEFVSAESAKTQGLEQFPASSEVLESLIGKGNRLEGQQSHGGFTRMVLGVAASVVRPTQDIIRDALASVKTRDVLDWVDTKLGASLQAQRRRTLGKVSYGTKMT